MDWNRTLFLCGGHAHRGSIHHEIRSEMIPSLPWHKSAVHLSCELLSTGFIAIHDKDLGIISL